MYTLTGEIYSIYFKVGPKNNSNVIIFTQGKVRHSFYGRLKRPQGQSGHEGIKKLHPFATRNQIRVVQPLAKNFTA